MKIKKIINKNGRKIFAIYECEYCGFEIDAPGSDDENFHQLLSKIKCIECGKASLDSCQSLNKGDKS